MDFMWDMMDVEMLAAGTSEKGTYHDSGTDCALTDDTNPSWLVVQHQHQHQQHHRTYSNETSGGVSEGPCLSTPSEEDKPEWQYGAALVVDREASSIPIAENNQQLFLPDLSGAGSYHLV
jgi:hypothetical protein